MQYIKQTAELAARGFIAAALVATGIVQNTAPTSTLFDQLFTVTTLKAGVAGAVISVGFSLLGKQGGTSPLLTDPARDPTAAVADGEKGNMTAGELQ